MLTGPERHVLKAIDAINLEAMDDQNSDVWRRQRGAARATPTSGRIRSTSGARTSGSS
jgi:hypothetical protein